LFPWSRHLSLCSLCKKRVQFLFVSFIFSLQSCRYYFSERAVRASTAMGASVVPIVESAGGPRIQMWITVARRAARSSFSSIADPSFALLSCGASATCSSCSALCHSLYLALQCFFLSFVANGGGALTQFISFRRLPHIYGDVFSLLSLWFCIWFYRSCSCGLITILCVSLLGETRQQAGQSAPSSCFAIVWSLSMQLCHPSLVGVGFSLFVVLSKSLLLRYCERRGILLLHSLSPSLPGGGVGRVAGARSTSFALLLPRYNACYCVVVSCFLLSYCASK
jgi:hypothetical protein